MSPISTYTPSSAVGAGTRAVEAGVGGSGALVFLSLKAMGGSEKQRTRDVRDTFRAQVFLSLKAMGGSEKQRTHDVRDTFRAHVFLSLKTMGGSEKQSTHDVTRSFHFLFRRFVCQVAFCRNGQFYLKHSF